MPRSPIRAGNLIFAKSGRNFCPLMATAADTVIVEAEEVVPPAPSIPTRSIFPAPLSTTSWRSRNSPPNTECCPNMSSKEKIAARAAREIRSGQVINLGIGIPTLILDYLPGRRSRSWSSRKTAFSASARAAATAPKTAT